MRCPRCGHEDDKVVDTRVGKDGESIRRRRECLACAYRFTTYETIAGTEKLVAKRDGRREEFNPEKLRQGVRRACWKRPVGEDQVEELVKRVVGQIESAPGREVTSKMLGEMVMEELRGLDEVAFVRFASVYRRFTDTDQFIKEIRRLTDQPADDQSR